MEFEQLADPVDYASKIEAAFTEESIQSIRDAAKPTQMPRADGSYEITECEDCGDDIPVERLKVAIKNTLCVFCAERRERKMK